MKSLKGEFGGSGGDLSDQLINYHEQQHGEVNLTKSVYGTGLVKNKHLHPYHLPYQSGCLASRRISSSFLSSGGRKTYPNFNGSWGEIFSSSFERCCNIA